MNVAEGTVIALDDARTQNLPHPMLSATFGGPIAVSAKPENGLQVLDALYRVKIRLDAPPEHNVMRKGSVTIDAVGASSFAQFFTDALGVLIREGGF